MSLQRCFECNQTIDTDYNAEHWDICSMCREEHCVDNMQEGICNNCINEYNVKFND